ncbi:hypothetical protein [Flavobacterium psychrotrophum]|uniref:hypothetical protein n=1 Tax=Flavobacterium psychrotrophum TaxID=2294119 RepID=UPI000E31750D|nr:hypothetical protein [Flavobacterium psychrotrophum]
MKVFIYILIALTSLLAIFNATQLDFDNLTEGNSVVALICTLAALCALCILLIFNTAKSIEQKTRQR